MGNLLEGGFLALDLNGIESYLSVVLKKEGRVEIGITEAELKLGMCYSPSVGFENIFYPL